MKPVSRGGKKEGSSKKEIPKSLWGEKKSEAYFRRAFSLNEKTENTVLRIFVDTGYELFLNERFVACVDEWNNTRDYDVAPFLLSGKNIITVKAMNHGGHRGIFLELRAVSWKGGIVSVISDSSWIAAL